MDSLQSDLHAPIAGRQEEHPWEKFEKLEYPNVFSHLSLAPDGGFSEVHTLYASWRWASTAMLILFVIYNVEYTVVTDTGFINNPNKVEGYTEEEMENINECFYMSRSIYDAIFRLINDWRGETVIEVRSIKPVQVLGFLEIFGLLIYTTQGLVWIVLIVVGRGKRRWHAVSDLFWYTLPVLSAYSAMKLLDNIVPTKLSTELTASLTQVYERKEQGAGFFHAWSSFLRLLCMTIVCFIIGFDMFLMKLRVVNTDAGHKSLSIENISPCILLLVQVLGVCQLGPFVRRRLFIFIFAGEDGVLQAHEEEVMLTWNALLARRIYREHSFAQFFAIMMSFSDEDFQSLVFNETGGEDESAKQTQLVERTPYLGVRLECD